MGKIWYAVLCGPDDADWGTGSFDLEEARTAADKLRSVGYRDAYIAVIDDAPDPVCIDTIKDF